MKVVGIYKITSPSGKVYIGQSVDIEKRFKTYLRCSCKSQKKLLASLIKHKPENHKYEILMVCEKEELSKYEKHFVDAYGSFNSDIGLNLRDGGGNGAKLSEDQKSKISNSLKGVSHPADRVEKNRISQLGKKLSQSHKDNISKGVKGIMLGVKLSDEHRLKLSLSHLGKESAMKGRKHSDKTKEIIRLKSTGVNNPNFGKKRTEESRLKIKESVTKYWKNKKSLCQEL
jgi:hypothetical protein